MRVSGSVSAMIAEVALVVLPPSLAPQELVFLIDTGFLGALALPETTIEALGLRILGQTEATLADGSVRISVVYEARLSWGESVLRVAALAMGDRPLLGTALLEGVHLGIDFIEGGAVTISSLSV
jgi:clan AA aspartic protease